MRVAVSLLCAIPVVGAGAFALLILPTGSPASDAFDLGAYQTDSNYASASQPRDFAAKALLSGVSPVPNSGSGRGVASTTAPGAMSSAEARSSASASTIVVAQGATPAKVIGLSSGGSPAGQQSSSTASSARPQARELTSSLQKELKRVGCYAGDVNGEWTQATRTGMNAFLQRLNASLPTAEPDFILLTLVQGQTSVACNAACAPGLSMTDGGKCAVTANVSVPPPVLMQRPPAKASVAERSGSQDIAGVAAAKPSDARPAEGLSPWRTGVTRAPSSAQPQYAATSANAPPAQVTQPTTSQAAVTAPMSGRMAIGGPASGAPMPDQATAELGSSSTDSTTGSVKPGVSATVNKDKTIKRNDTRERTAEAPRPRPNRDASWTRNFFDR